MEYWERAVTALERLSTRRLEQKEPLMEPKEQLAIALEQHQVYWNLKKCISQTPPSITPSTPPSITPSTPPSITPSTPPSTTPPTWEHWKQAAVLLERKQKLEQLAEETRSLLREFQSEFDTQLDGPWSSPKAWLDIMERVVDFGESMGGTTHAPIGWDAQTTPLPFLYRPPNPQEEQMRAGALFELGQSQELWGLSYGGSGASGREPGSIGIVEPGQGLKQPGAVALAEATAETTTAPQSIFHARREAIAPGQTLHQLLDMDLEEEEL